VPEQTGFAPTTGPVGVIVVPHEFVTAGGVGTVCALLIQATVDPPAAGAVNVGGDIVYVYTHCAELPVQSVYVHVYVFVPEQTGSAPTVGPVGVIVLPHEFVTVGGVGTTWALLIHATVEPPAAGNVKVGGDIVYVYTHWADTPVQSVYVKVYVFVPEHDGSGPATGPVIVKVVPQELVTAGGVGTTCAFDIHATVEPEPAGNVKVGGDIV
jgi:hypothetical protein